MAISTEAAQEAALQEMLRKVVDSWGAIEFQVKVHKDAKDVFILGSVQEVLAQLDESRVTMSAIASSRYGNHLDLDHFCLACQSKTNSAHVSSSICLCIIQP